MYNIYMIKGLKRRIKALINKVIPHRSSITPLITITISRSALLHNLAEFKKITPHGNIAPTLKSNAYGHGLVLIAKELESQNLPFFVIDSYFEAMILRNNGIRTPLLIIGYSATNTIINNNLKNINFTITSLDSLKDLLEKIKNNVSIHLKIDTGMHRQGILEYEVDQAFDLIKKSKYIKIEGISSHFSDADGDSTTFTEKQIERWNKIVEKVKKELPNIKYFHLSNTYGHKFSNKIDANVSRLGIGLYGLANINSLSLKPILEMNTIITGVKKIKKGEFVGYNNTFTAEKDMSIATIPVGYYEGLNRRLSDVGHVKIKNTFCKIVGRVSMNITTIDVSEIKDIKIGDIVEVISKTSSDKNSIQSISEPIGTIPYEAVIKIPERIRRVVV